VEIGYSLDTNICIYLLDGDIVLAELLNDQDIIISFITQIELYAYHGNSETSIAVLDDFIKSVTVIDITPEIKQQTIHIRKKYKLKIPDSIIAATVLANSVTFISADKAFKRVTELELLLYKN
jgi:predicted nucleic acid-binding protein